MGDSDTRREELYNKVGRIIGSAILKNDKNYTNDMIAVINAECMALLERLKSERQGFQIPLWAIEQAKKEYEKR